MAILRTVADYDDPALRAACLDLTLVLARRGLRFPIQLVATDEAGNRFVERFSLEEETLTCSVDEGRCAGDGFGSPLRLTFTDAAGTVAQATIEAAGESRPN